MTPTSRRTPPLVLTALGLITLAAAPMSAWADNCPSGGCKRAEPAARPAPAAAPRPGPGGGGVPGRPSSFGPPQGGPSQGRPSFTPTQQGRPGVGGPQVHQSGARLGGPPGRGGVYSPNRSFNFHGRSFAAVRARPYRYPRGYGYHPYYAGQRFPAFLLLTPYFITNYALYNLSAPPDPALVWVRYGPDALLVNTYTGEVVDTAPGVFDEDPGDDGGAYAQAPDGSGYGPPPPPPGYGGPPPGSQDGGDAPYPGPTGYPEPPPGGPQP